MAHHCLAWMMVMLLLGWFGGMIVTAALLGPMSDEEIQRSAAQHRQSDIEEMIR